MHIHGSQVTFTWEPVFALVTGVVWGWLKSQKQYEIVGFSLIELPSKDIALSRLLKVLAKNGFREDLDV